MKPRLHRTHRDLHQLRHLLERLGRGLLELRGVNHRSAVEQHLGCGASLDAARLALLAARLVAHRRRGPPAVRKDAHPRLQQERLPVHALEAGLGQQVERVQHVVVHVVGYDVASRNLVSGCVG